MKPAVVLPLLSLCTTLILGGQRVTTSPSASQSGGVATAQQSDQKSAGKKGTRIRNRKIATLSLQPAVKHYVSFREVEGRRIYQAIEKYLYRMCIKEVPFFLALHACYHKDVRLNKGDTLVLGKKVLQALLLNASRKLSTEDLVISPATNIDSILLFRPSAKRKKTTRCILVVYTKSGTYEIPKTGARVWVPRVVKGSVSWSVKRQIMVVTVVSPGVKLLLPSYAKLLSLGMITDMDVRYAQLLPSGNGFEARLLYAPSGRTSQKKGWSFNVTECNKIRPYSQ